MASPLPFDAEENFESGTRGNFDVESGTLIDFPHYSALASQGLAPYRGAHCLRVRLAGGTTSQFVREDTGMDQAVNVDRFLRWYFYLGPDFTMADADKFSMVEGESTLDTTTEYAAGIDRSGSTVRFWFAETAAAATVRTFALGTLDPPGNPRSALGRWYHAELSIALDNPVAGDGTLDAWIDDASAGAQITGLVQAAIVDVKFGTIGPDAGTSGTVLIDDIIFDDARVRKDTRRFRDHSAWVYSDDDHPLIGPGVFSAGVTGTGTNAVLELYDSDGVPSSATKDPIAILRNVSANEFIPGHDLFKVSHGLYTVLTGTAAQAFISIEKGGLVSQGSYVTRGRATGKPKGV